MKKWLTCIILSALLLTAVPSFNATAAETDWSGTFTASGENNNINVTLLAPQTQTEDITSLHYRIYISIANGSMDVPTFQFASTVESKVKDVAAIKDGSSNYILDIILSGTKDQNIFQTSKQADIGTITLHPTTNTYKITTDFTGINNDSKEPAAEYVTSEGQYAQEVPLINTKSITIEKTSSSGSSGSNIYIGSGGTATDYTGGGTSTTAPSATPGNTAAPTGSAAPSASNAPTTAPTTSETPDASQEPASFDTNQKPALKTTVAKGSKNVKFSWNKVDGADGYIICQYNKKNSKYKSIKTIANPDKTTCSLKMNYATSYSFRIRAFKTSEDGSKVYGKYSSIIKVTTAPAKTNGLKVRRARNSKVSVSWKKVQRASGYQIFSSKKKNGKYSLVKTIKKGSTLSTTVKQKNKKACYYKVRAYVTNANKKRVYGNFSKSLPSKS